MDKSHPIYREDEHSHPNTKTSSAKYHDLHVEIKGNHPLANSYNYSLSVNGGQEHGVSQRAELSDVPNPSPRGKGPKKPKY